jgi:16S rRNA (cytosine967-C5)-methyltransferase
MSDKMRGRIYSLLTDFYAKRWSEDYFLDSVMRKFYRKLYFEIFRNLGTIEKAVGRFTEFKPSPELMAALVMGSAQLLYMRDVPDYAAVNESVDLVGKNKRGFVNALLRKVIKHREEILASAVESDNFPGWLHERWRAKLGNAECERVMAAYNQAPPLFSLNTETLEITECEEYDELAENLYYMDRASAIVPMLAGDFEAASVLDCCAAPGGKTIVLSRKYPEAVVFAVEVNKNRYDVLEENVEKYALENVQPVNNDIMKLEGDEAFELILLDAPCTAIGTMRKHPELRWQRNEKQIYEKAVTQRKMITKTAGLLAKRGKLIYSVCTTEPEETTEVIEGFLAENKNFRIVQPHCPDEFLKGNYFISNPAETNSDGFFAAVLTKN